jgi:acyl-CoA thioester hydrolase
MTPPDAPPETRARFAHFLDVPTRWMDNDIYGHVNNVVYYAYFDTVINRYLIEAGGLDIAAGPIIGLAVETGCRFLRPLAFPEVLEAGLRVGHLGNSSVRYEIGIFQRNRDDPAALGRFTHVFVDRKTRRPTPIPPALRDALSRLIR